MEQPVSIYGSRRERSLRLQQGSLLLLAQLPLIAPLEQFVSLEVEGSAQLVTILAGTMKTSDQESNVEPTTFVPDCQSYDRLPCSCGQALLSPHHRGFWPGYDHLWHKASIMKLLTVQHVYRREVSAMVYTGPYFWHAAGFGNFKNGLDVPYFIASAYGQSFNDECTRNNECTLTQAFTNILNWLITMKQFSIFPVQDQLDPFVPVLDAMAGPEVIAYWLHAPWRILLEKPDWAESFCYVIQGLEDVLAADGDLTEFPDDEEERFHRSCLRMGMDTSEGMPCSEIALWRKAGLSGARGKEEVLSNLIRLVFEKPCFSHGARSMVVFGAAVRQLLPRPAGLPWPPHSMPARSVDSPSYWRFCNQPDVAHRRVGDVELHFMSADVVQIGDELHLELLWMATSDDNCIMVGTNFHNDGASYYSFVHTLPHAHLTHWECSFRAAGGRIEQLGHRAGAGAATSSISGFTTVTSCRIPASSVVAKMLLSEEFEDYKDLELKLTPTASSAWNPEPLHLCPLPRPATKRILSACTATLHSADYVHRVLPHAVEDWLNYHFLIGVQHFTLFDTDGSYEPYVRHFVERGMVTYHPRFPGKVATKLGLSTSGLRSKEEHRHMLMEPHALEQCVWENRQLSDWVVVVHSFEEYLHSPLISQEWGILQIGHLIQQWSQEVPGTAVFELFQEPMGGPRNFRAETVFSSWTRKRGLEITDFKEGFDAMAAHNNHFQPFAWILDPINILQTAVHFAQARADGQHVIVVPKQNLRLNHYVDFGVNSSRCLHELGGCEYVDDSMRWAEAPVVAMRH